MTTVVGLMPTGAVRSINGGQDGLQVHGNTGATETIDLANGNVHIVTQDMACTFTFTAASSTRAIAFRMIFTAVTGGTTWPGTVKWPGGTPPTLTGICIVDFISYDNRASWLGVLVANDYS